MTAKSDQEFPALHHLFAIEPNVEIATDAVDVCFGNPVGASVLSVRVAKSDVDSRNFLVLQNVSNDEGMTRRRCPWRGRRSANNAKPIASGDLDRIYRIIPKTSRRA